ncbi:MAG: N-acetyltransferase [Mariprofundaceae bacterium]
MSGVHIRHAAASDVKKIDALLSPFSAKEALLPRTRDDLFQHLQEFMVATDKGEVIGAVALHIYGSNLAEIRTLVVHASHQGKGVGKQLVQACETWAIKLGIACLFALTYLPGFFTALHYEHAEKESLPQKIWTVCIHCAHFSNCNEVCVRKQLSNHVIKPMQIPKQVLTV